MPMGKGTYGSKRGRPSKKAKMSMTPAKKILFHVLLVKEGIIGRRSLVQV